jgi:hypothetical protein
MSGLALYPAGLGSGGYVRLAEPRLDAEAAPRIAQGKLEV